MFRNEDNYNLGPSVEGFERFLETKNPDEAYKWMDGGNCACAQYSHTMGFKDNQWIHKITIEPIWHELNLLARGSDKDAKLDDWTFGKCLKRVKEYETV